MLLSCISIPMASDNSKIIERIAFCSVLCAGFAYAGYTIVSSMCHKKENKKHDRFTQTHFLKFLKNQHSQTEVSDVVNKSEEVCGSPKSVRERVYDLNQSERLRKRSVPISPDIKPYSSHSSPWSSPLGCAKFLSVSAENISTRTSPPEPKRKGNLAASHSVLNVELQSKLTSLEIAERLTSQFINDDCTIPYKCLNNLQKSPSQMTAFEIRNLVHLLRSSNEDVLLKTLFTISNCAAFSNNQELICESECPKQLKELLLTQSETVKIAVTQAISNISVIDKSHRYFQTHIPILLNNATHSRELLKSLSLTCLANLALDPASHKMMIRHVQPVASMACTGTGVVQLQALRLLVNLSCNDNVIPALLMSEVPCDFLKMLNSSCDRELLLRLLTFLSNIAVFARQYVCNSSKSTLLSVLYYFTKEIENSDLMMLSSEEDDNISFQAKRLLSALSGLS